MVNLLLCVLLISTLQDVLSESPCTESEVPTNVEACLIKIRAAINDDTAFWFGKDYPSRCTNPPGWDLACDNPFPDPQYRSLAGQIFGVSLLDTSTITSYMDVRFTSYPGSYDGCGTTVSFYTPTDIRVDPLEDTPLLPWHTRVDPLGDTPVLPWHTDPLGDTPVLPWHTRVDPLGDTPVLPWHTDPLGDTPLLPWHTRVDPLGDTPLLPWHTRDKPTITMVTEGPAPAGLYTLVIVDAGYREVHGVFVNVHADLSGGKVEVAYQGAKNPISVENPYVFVLYQQQTDDMVIPTTVLDLLINPNTLDLIAFKESVDLQGPISVTWYKSWYDIYSVQAARESGTLENCASFVTPALLAEGRPWVPNSTILTVYTEAVVLSQPLNYTFCCKDFQWGTDPVPIDTLGGGVYDAALARTGVPIEIRMTMNKKNPTTDDFTDKYYTLMAVDPDQRRADSNRFPGLHWTLVNLQIIEPAIVSSIGSESSGPTSSILDQSSGVEILPWNGPGPPSGDPPHGYYFLVYEQPSPDIGFSSKDDEEFYRYNQRTCLNRKCSFDLNGFVGDYNLSLVGAAWMYSEYTEYRAWSRGEDEETYCRNTDPAWVSLSCPEPCSKEAVQTPEGLEACMYTIRESLVSGEEFWFGKTFPLRCPDPSPRDTPCSNPLTGPGTWSLAGRIFRVPEHNTSSLDSSIYITFTSQAGSYSGCGTAVTFPEDTHLEINPTSGQVVEPWHVRVAPSIRVYSPWGQLQELHTLVIVDAGVNILHGLYINMRGDDIHTAEAVVPYRGALNFRAQAQPYVFVLYPQADHVTSVPDDVMQRLSNPDTLNLTAFQEDMTFRDPKAISWYRAWNDLYSVQTMKDRGIAENCNSFIEPALHNENRSWVPLDTDLSVYTVAEVQSVPINYTMCNTEYHWGSDPVEIDTLGDHVYDPALARTGVPIDIHVNMNVLSPDPDTDFIDQTYTLLGVDPDIPAPVGEEYPYLHWLLVDAPVAASTLDQPAGRTLAPWVGPGPPEGTGPHGYYFLLYRQPGERIGINSTEDPAYTEHCLSGSGRCLFNVKTFAEAFDLELVGAAWMYSEFSDYSAWSRGVDECEYCRGREGWDGCSTTTPPQTSTASSKPTEIIIILSIICLCKLCVIKCNNPIL